MNRAKLHPKLIAGILVALVLGLSLYLRIVLPYGSVFVGEWIKFTGTDAYFFMRIVDNLVHNFPHLITFDPYALYPGGSGISSSTSFFVYFIAAVTWFIGLGSPTQHMVDIVGAYFPAVLGGLTVLPVYFIGKVLFNRWAGVMAAGLIAIFPGEFLGRSILGFTDYHVAEVLFTTLTMLFLILAVKTASQRQLAFSHLKHLYWSVITRPLVYSLLAGIFLGIYFLTWAGALLFVFITFIYFVIQFIIDHVKGRSTDYLCYVSAVSFTVALLLILHTSPNNMTLASLIIAIIIPIALAAVSHFMASRGIKPLFYPVVVLGLGLAGLAILRIISPALFQAMVGSLSFFSWPVGTTVLEMQPILLPGGNFSWAVAWGNFTTSFFLCFISLCVLSYFVIKHGEADKTLFIIWSLVILAATLSMRRSAYYFVVNVALLVGYLSWLILEFAGFKKLTAAVVVEIPERAKRKKSKRKDSRKAGSWVNMSLGVIFIFFLVFFPNIGKAVGTASGAYFAPSDAWCESLSWLSDNTPEPFGNPDLYYQLYESPPQGESYDYPKTAYGVTAWWDYGYWITRMGRRIPTANPGTGHRGEAAFFTSQDETSANKIMDNWNSRYVIVDRDIATVALKFHALATLSGGKRDNFVDVYYQPQDGKLRPMMLFYPEYYRCLVVRLYNFDGGSVIPKNISVISYENKADNTGSLYKEVTSAKTFTSYESAKGYVASQKSGNYRIVGTDPFTSPVPLESLKHYRLIHGSKSSIMEPSIGRIAEVKIFEYTK